MTSLTLRWVEGAESVTWLSCPADLLVVLQVRLGEAVEVLRADPTGAGRLPRIAHPDDPDLQARYAVRAAADLDAVRLTDLQAAVSLLAALGDTGGGVTRASYGMEVADRDVARFAARSTTPGCCWTCPTPTRPRSSASSWSATGSGGGDPGRPVAGRPAAVTVVAVPTPPGDNHPWKERSMGATPGSTLTRPDVDVDTTTEDALDVPHHIVVWDDPINLMAYVVLIFKQVFGMDDATANTRMLEVHEDGRSLVWHGLPADGEPKLLALHQAGLNATLEKA